MRNQRVPNLQALKENWNGVMAHRIALSAISRYTIIKIKNEKKKDSQSNDSFVSFKMDRISEVHRRSKEQAVFFMFCFSCVSYNLKTREGRVRRKKCNSHVII